MDKRTLRAFAAGLFLAAILFLGYQFIKAEPPQTKGNLSAESTANLKKDVYYWQTKYTKLLQQKTAKNNQELTRYHLTISSGMTPGIIADRLKTGKILSDPSAFMQYLVDHKDENKVQPGEYDLTSQMTVSQIVNAITKNK
ncbi:endolytic transglycosylase MltG [Heyndrickxia acidicola]|uniref:Endolytic transglycosylase MltG n=1 Tax=Heyndrickxia acidicola TaxID=209389 RepID=A0ABU6MKC5_9BACI|nr:endolytic transglycosylase MltG [Heyndrickxia acidicola]MED1205129.1 endolytic transglycosylase MltG [Heyndrickxia acidicola]